MRMELLTLRTTSGAQWSLGVSQSARVGRASPLVVFQCLKSEDTATGTRNTSPKSLTIEFVAKAYQVLLKWTKPGSGKFLLIASPDLGVPGSPLEWIMVGMAAIVATRANRLSPIPVNIQTFLCFAGFFAGFVGSSGVIVFPPSCPIIVEYQLLQRKTGSYLYSFSFFMGR